MEEIWKDIPGHAGYQASTLGRIRSVPTVIDHPRGMKYTVSGRIRKGLPNHRGYLMVQLTSKGKTMTMHRLVALTFIPNPNDYPELNHINGIKTDNSVANLEWCTRKQNHNHALDTGLLKPPSGTNHWNSLLDEIQVKTIRKCLNDGMTAYKLAKYFKVSYNAIRDIKIGKSYKEFMVW